MRAMVYHEYGSPDNLQLQDIEMPAVRDAEVLVRVEAASVNRHDYHFLTGKPLLARLMAGGLLKPRNPVLGSDFAGRVEAIGDGVKEFRPGDAVFGSTRRGCFAEYVCVSEQEVVMKPDSITFEEAAAAGAAAFTALQGLRDAGKIQSGQQLLVNGASGAVGMFAVQIAKSFGAEVTGVCGTPNLEMVRSIGADWVIDYSQQDFTRGERVYDLIYDVAAKLAFADCKGVLGRAGIFVTTEFSPVLALTGMWKSLAGDKKMVAQMAKPPSKDDLVFMADLLEGGQVTPVIDRRYPLREVPEALRYLAAGHARGKVIITV